MNINLRTVLCTSGIKARMCMKNKNLPLASDIGIR